MVVLGGVVVPLSINVVFENCMQRVESWLGPCFFHGDGDVETSTMFCFKKCPFRDPKAKNACRMPK